MNSSRRDERLPKGPRFASESLDADTASGSVLFKLPHYLLFWRIACCTVLAASMLGQEPPQPAPAAVTPSEISGVLVDAVTGQPIRHARIAIAPVTQRDAYTTILTDEGGGFLFSNLAPGKYTLTAQQRGYFTQSFNQHEQFSSAIVVGPDPDSTHLLFRLQPECLVRGRISDEAGEPVRNARVFLYQAEHSGGEQDIRLGQRGTTDEEGVYQFAHLHPGRYFVAVMATVWYAQRPAPQQDFSTSFSPGYPGRAPSTYPEEEAASPLDVAYPITFYPGTTETSAASPVVVKAGDRFTADVVLQPVPALHLRVPAGPGDEGVGSRTNAAMLQSRLFDAEAIPFPVERHILSSGEVDIVGLPPGHYQVQNLENGRPASSGEMTALTSGDLHVERQAAFVGITATVQLDPGTALPLQGALQLRNPRSQEIVSEQVSGAGEIEFRQSIEPGRYELSLSNNDSEYIKTVSAAGAAVNGRTLEVKGGSPLKLSVAVARGQAQIQGVALRDGKPFIGAMILLVPADPAHNQVLFRRNQSDSDGSFTLGSIVPGKYTLLAIENGWDLEWLNPAALKPYVSGGEALQIEQYGKYEVKVKVQ